MPSPYYIHIRTQMHDNLFELLVCLNKQRKVIFDNKADVGFGWTRKRKQWEIFLNGFVIFSASLFALVDCRCYCVLYPVFYWITSHADRDRNSSVGSIVDGNGVNSSRSKRSSSKGIFVMPFLFSCSVFILLVSNSNRILQRYKWNVSYVLESREWIKFNKPYQYQYR